MLLTLLSSQRYRQEQIQLWKLVDKKHERILPQSEDSGLYFLCYNESTDFKKSTERMEVCIYI